MQQRCEHDVGEPQLLTKLPRDACVVSDHGVHLAVAREHELETHAEAVQRRVAGSDQSEGCSRSAEVRVVPVLVGLQRDVVSEPLGLLVCVGVAADVNEQRGVVDGAAFAIVEADSIGDAQGDDALAQDVLHRLPEAEVDAERQRRDELGEPHVQTISVRHAAILRPRPAHLDPAGSG